MKKVLKIIGLIILIFLFLPGLYIIQNYSFQRSFEKNYQKEKIRNTQDFVRCNYNFLNPEFAFLFDLGEGEDKHIAFHKTKKLLSLTEEGWDISYTGGTTITNTTFPELVKMVKEDCGQFQDDYNNPDPNGIDWGYREADPPEPPKTQEELKYETEQNYYAQIKALKYVFNETFTDYQQEKFIEMFGDIRSMTNDEIFNLKNKIDEGGGLEVLFKEYLFDEGGNLIFREQE